MFGFDAAELLQSYGYLALLIGTFLEGETIVIVAGFFSHKQLLSPYLVALTAFVGSVTSDQLMFMLGRWKGIRLIERFPRLARNMDKATKLMQRYETPLILGFRFVYGVRNVTPFLMGVSKVSYLKFVTLNMLGAAVWAVSFTAGGYFFGAWLKKFMASSSYAMRFIIGALLVAGMLYLLFRKKNGCKSVAHKLHSRTKIWIWRRQKIQRAKRKTSTSSQP